MAARYTTTGARTKKGRIMNRDGLREIGRRGPRKLAVLAAVLTVTAWLGAVPASATTWTVCPSGCAYTEIGPAVAAASSGDTVSVGPGAYLGGFTIDKSLTLDGAGARRTIVSGGGPVITIGSGGATIERTVGDQWHDDHRRGHRYQSGVDSDNR